MTASGEQFRTFRDGWVVAVGATTVVVALVCGVALEAWAQGPPPHHDYFEPYLRPWAALTWLTQLALWIALPVRRWPWLVLTATGVCCLAIQVWMAIGSALIGVQDGKVGGIGALVGGLSIAQLSLTVAWVALIARSKRMPS